MQYDLSRMLNLFEQGWITTYKYYHIQYEMHMMQMQDQMMQL